MGNAHVRGVLTAVALAGLLAVATGGSRRPTGPPSSVYLVVEGLDSLRIVDSEGRVSPCEGSDCVGIPGIERLDNLSLRNTTREEASVPRVSVAFQALAGEQYVIEGVGTGGSASLEFYSTGVDSSRGSKDVIDVPAGTSMRWRARWMLGDRKHRPLAELKRIK